MKSLNSLYPFLHLLIFLPCSLSSIQLRPAPASSIESQSCWLYECKSQSDWCVHPIASNKTYQLSTCLDSRPYCDTSNMAIDSLCSSTYPKDGSTLAFPGEPCSKDSDCELDLCLGSTCFGKVLNEDCESNLECNPGLRCHLGKCSTLQRSGSACESDYDCIPSHGCNNRVCTEYFSLAAGTIVSDCNNGDQTSLFCAESSCIYNSKSRVGICIPPYKSVNASPACTSSAQCVGESTYNGVKYSKVSSCQCGMNALGNMYCFPHDGDDSAVEFRKWWKRFIGLGYLGVCNTERRFEQACFDISVESYFYVKMLKSYYEYYNFPQLYKAGTCVRQVFYQVIGFSKLMATALAWVLF